MKLKNRRAVLVAILTFSFLYSIWSYVVYLYTNFKYDLHLDNIWIYINYPVSKFLNITGIHIGRMDIPPELYEYTADYFPQSDIVAWGFADLVNTLPCASVFKPLPYLTICFAVFAIFISLILRENLEGDIKAKAVRGAKVATEKDLVRQLKREQKQQQTALFADPILIPHIYETRHILIAGSTGTGKSVVLAQFIASAREQKMLIYDRKGELFAKFGRKKDIIWNPYDSRFCGWNIFNLIEITISNVWIN